MKKGLLIAIEGPDGVGKTTLSKKLFDEIHNNLDDYCVKSKEQVRLFREPGGNKVAEGIREIIKSNTPCPVTDLFLFIAARSELIEKEVKPILEKGGIVILDRYTPSTYVYQIYKHKEEWERRYGKEFLDSIDSLLKNKSLFPQPDLYVHVKVNDDTHKRWNVEKVNDRFEHEYQTIKGLYDDWFEKPVARHTFTNSDDNSKEFELPCETIKNKAFFNHAEHEL